MLGSSRLTPNSVYWYSMFKFFLTKACFFSIQGKNNLRRYTWFILTWLWTYANGIFWLWTVWSYGFRILYIVVHNFDKIFCVHRLLQIFWLWARAPAIFVFMLCQVKIKFGEFEGKRLDCNNTYKSYFQCYIYSSFKKMLINPNLNLCHILIVLFQVHAQYSEEYKIL